MWSLIFPPIGIFAGIIFLIWLFLKKRHSLDVEGIGRKTVAQILSPPQGNPKQENMQAEIMPKKAPLPILIGQMMQSFFLWVWGGVKKRLTLGSRRGAPAKSSLKEEAHFTGVSSMMTSDRKYATMREISVVEKSGSETGESKKKQGYFEGRPMISDEITLPQKNGEKDQYEQVLVERIALNPRDIEAYERLGDYYMENGNLEDAKECFKQVLRLSPLSRRARFRMRRIEKNLSKK